MQRSASVLQGVVDMVCTGKRLDVHMQNCGFPFAFEDDMADLAASEKAQVRAKVHKCRGVCGIYIAPTIKQVILI